MDPLSLTASLFGSTSSVLGKTMQSAPSAASWGNDGFLGLGNTGMSVNYGAGGSAAASADPMSQLTSAGASSGTMTLIMVGVVLWLALK